jgi:hypothetical protein
MLLSYAMLVIVVKEAKAFWNARRLRKLRRLGTNHIKAVLNQPGGKHAE